MKKWLVSIICSFMFVMLLAVPVKAASFNISASKKQVKPNSSFTVSVGGDCIGRVNLSVTNGTLSTNSVWVEQNYQTVTVTAGSSGSVTVTATPVAGFSDSDANEYRPGSRSVNVSIVSDNSSDSQTKPQTTPDTDKKSSNNLLSSLTINSGVLTPAFDTNVSEYTVQLPSDVTTIVVDAKSSDKNAKVNGAGEINVVPGDNTINITVTAENGSKKTYVINAYVNEVPQVYLKYKDKDIGVVRNLKGLILPEGFSEKEYYIDNYSISIFSNEHFSILYGIDNENIKNFYIFDTTKNECVSKIIPMTIDNHFFYLVDLDTEKEGFEMSSIIINNQEVIGYKFKDGFTNYFLLSVINSDGEKLEYLYETKEGTLQLYSGSAPITYDQYESLIKELNIKQVIIYSISLLLVLSIVCLFFLILKVRKEESHEKEN